VLRLWDLKTGQESQVLEGHTEWVSCVSADWSAFRAATGSGDKTIRLWDLRDFVCTRVLAGHTESVSCVTLDLLRLQLISGGRDGTLRVWSLSERSLSESTAGVKIRPHESSMECMAVDLPMVTESLMAAEIRFSDIAEVTEVVADEVALGDGWRSHPTVSQRPSQMYAPSKSNVRASRCIRACSASDSTFPREGFRGI